MIPSVINGRGSDVLQVAGEAGLAAPLRHYLSFASGWCGVSQDLVDTLDQLGGDAGRGRLVPNGVDTERFHPRDRGPARAARLPELGPEAPLVLVVGHLIPRKDPLLALAAFRAAGLARRGGRLVFVGRGPLEDELRAASSDLGGAVELVGECEPNELAEWYAAADCLLLTSSREGRPNVVLEALASGRPVLATAAGGTAEVLEGLPGMLATDRDPEALGALLNGLLTAEWEPDRLAAHVAPLSWEASAEALEELLEDLRRTDTGDTPLPSDQVARHP